MENWVLKLESLLSGALPFVLILTVGLFFSFSSHGFQFRFLIKSFKNAFSKSKSDDVNSISPFQAACTSLSATVGTGNIAGVAGAVAIGGAGAIFWMWISALLGMIVKLCEITLSVFYREKHNNEFVGGPMYYIKNGLKKGLLPLAFVFSVAAVLASFSSGNLTQINTVAAVISNNSKTKIIIGIFTALIVYIILKGGAKRIAVATEAAVPFMAVLYLILSLIIICINYASIPKAFAMIIQGAFNPYSVTGGAVGTISASILTGSSRGVFSNEAGLGTSAMAHAKSNNKNCVKEGLFGIFEVFVDTIIICTATALVLLCSGIEIKYGSYASSDLIKESFSTVYGNFTNFIMPMMIALFALTSVIGWGYYGLQCIEFLFGKKSMHYYVIIYSMVCIVGSVTSTEIVWRLSAFLNGIMLCINLLSIFLLRNQAIALINKYANIEKNKSR